jgi:hypothetical protein
VKFQAAFVCPVEELFHRARIGGARRGYGCSR